MKTYDIEGMSCGACVKRVETALKAFGSDVSVTLKPPLVKMNTDRDLAELNAALDDVGGYVLRPARQ
jgi:copper chaperone CopZ